MLNRQYGIAASSSIVKVAHPEDSQPNERIHGRNRNMPPKLNTVRPPRFDRVASNSSGLGTQLAKRGTWSTRLPSRIRSENLSRSGSSCPRRNAHIATEAPAAKPTSTATNPAQASSSSSTWGALYRSISPQLPIEPLRRRTPLGTPRPSDDPQANQEPPQRPHSPLPLPGRKRKAKDSLPSALPPLQKLKVEQPETSRPPIIKPESLSPEPIATSRSLIRESCKFWPIPDNCKKSVLNYSDNRRDFARSKGQELARFGLKRTRAFFRDDGLVIDWTSKVPVWNDTLLPENHESTTSSRKSPSDVSSAETPKRKREIIEIVDSDEEPTENLPSKKSRPSNPDLAIASVQKPSDSAPKTPSPKKKKTPVTHWSAGLSKENILKLGRGVEAACLKPVPPPPTFSPPSSCNQRASASVTPFSSPSKRLPLPTRLTPSERKAISASSSPDRDRMPISTIVTTCSSTLSSSPPATVASNPTISQPPLSFDDLNDFLFGIFVNEPVVPASKAMSAHVDNSATSTSVAGAVLPEGGEEQHFDDSTLSGEAGAQTSLTMDSQVITQPDDMKHDETTLSQAEPRETVEATNEADTPAEDGKVVHAQVDTSASNLTAAIPEGGENQHPDNTPNSDEVGAQTSRTNDLQVIGKPNDTKNDEYSLSEAESQEIERLCTEDTFVDLPEYEMAEEFLRRFISLFDTDRNELRMAYSNVAFLSCRVPSTEPESSTSTSSPSYSSKSTLHIGRTEIIDKLNGLVGYHFSPVGVPNSTINYDIAVLSQELINSGLADGGPIDKNAVGGILATLHSHIVHSSSGFDRTMTLHQSFVLQRRTELDGGLLDEPTSKQSWPLTVISHHMILRDEPLLRTDQLDRLCSPQHR